MPAIQVSIRHATVWKQSTKQKNFIVKSVNTSSNIPPHFQRLLTRKARHQMQPRRPFVSPAASYAVNRISQCDNSTDTSIMSPVWCYSTSVQLSPCSRNKELSDRVSTWVDFFSHLPAYCRKLASIRLMRLLL